MLAPARFPRGHHAGHRSAPSHQAGLPPLPRRVPASHRSHQAKHGSHFRVGGQTGAGGLGNASERAGRTRCAGCFAHAETGADSPAVPVRNAPYLSCEVNATRAASVNIGRAGRRAGECLSQAVPSAVPDFQEVLGQITRGAVLKSRYKSTTYARLVGAVPPVPDVPAFRKTHRNLLGAPTPWSAGVIGREADGRLAGRPGGSGAGVSR